VEGKEGLTCVQGFALNTRRMNTPLAKMRTIIEKASFGGNQKLSFKCNKFGLLVSYQSGGDWEADTQMWNFRKTCRLAG
jgi:hypothetical protein